MRGFLSIIGKCEAVNCSSAPTMTKVVHRIAATRMEILTTFKTTKNTVTVYTSPGPKASSSNSSSHLHRNKNKSNKRNRATAKKKSHNSRDIDWSRQLSRTRGKSYFPRCTLRAIWTVSLHRSNNMVTNFHKRAILKITLTLLPIRLIWLHFRKKVKKVLKMMKIFINKYR